MAMDAVPIDLLRSSLDSLKLRFQAANDPGSPSKAWLVHVHDKGEEKPAIFARADGFDSPTVKPSPSTCQHLGVPAIGRRKPRFRRCVRLNGYQHLEPICEDAARLLDGLPTAVQSRLWRGLPAGTELTSGLSLWVLAVFELANANVFPLRDARRFPIDGEQAKTIFAPESRLPADADWYTTLPDFAAASVQAVAILQSWLPDVPKQEAKVVAGDKSEDRIVAAIANLLEKPKRKRKKEQQAEKTVAEQQQDDAKLGDLWLAGHKSGKYVKYADMPNTRLELWDVKASLDRDRHKRPDVWRANKKPRRKKAVKTR